MLTAEPLVQPESWHSVLLISISWVPVSIGSMYADLHIATSVYAEGSDHGVSLAIWQEAEWGSFSDRSSSGSIYFLTTPSHPKTGSFSGKHAVSYH